jgi:predicted nucleic acid-binding protein
VEWLRSGRVQAVLDDRIVVEYSEVLVRPSLGLPTAEVKVVLDSIRARALWVEGAVVSTVRALPDPDDAPFLECALAAGVPLVTGNLRHFPKSATQNVRVITPARFVALSVSD